MSNRAYCYIDLRLQAAEINERLEHAKEPYVAFGYGDEQRATRYFDTLARVAASRSDCVAALGMLLVAEEKQASFQAHFPENGAMLDSQADFTYGLLYPDGLLCSTQKLQETGLRFDEALEICRDDLFAMQLSLVVNNVLYVSGCSYLSERVFDETSRNVPQASDARWYWEATGPVFKALKESGGGTLAPTAQYGMLYMLIQRFNSNQNKYVKAVFADQAETRRFVDSASEVLREIDDKVLFRRTPAIAWSRPRLLHFARMKYGAENLRWKVNAKPASPTLLLCNSKPSVRVERLGEVALLVHGLELATGPDGRAGFRVTARYFTQFPADSVSVYLKNKYEGGEEVCQLQPTSVYASRMAFFGEVAYVNTLHEGFIPLADKTCAQTITAYARVENREVELRLGIVDVGPNHLRQNRARETWHVMGYAVRSKEWRIEIRPESDLHFKLREAFRCLRLLRRGEVARKAARVRWKYLHSKRDFENRRIWVYFDKGFKGGDNGEFAFRYAASQDDGIEHVYFIQPDSRDGAQLIAEGLRTCKPGDVDAMVLALNAEVVFYTQIPAFKGVGIGVPELRYYKDLLDQKLVRMYHGFMLTHDPSYSQQHMNALATVVGSRYEHDLCAEPAHGWQDDCIIDSGMPRHDGLVADNRRQLLFAPTWRPTLRTGIGETGETLYNPEFKESRYYERYASIFSDERLLGCARENGYKIKLFLHPRLAPQTVDFPSNDVFEALDCTKDSDYVTMMRQSDLMVTDYSSVMVDFAYSRKPVVYYQDPALPYWRYVDFDYEGIGFGEVCTSADELIDVLCGYMQSDCALKDFYRKRINDFFFHDDFDNSKRLYEAVRAMVG